MWHFYAGEALDIFIIDPKTGELRIIRLGTDPEKGEVFQGVVPAGAWFASRPAQGSSYALVGCTVAPGFAFDDFEMADRLVLSEAFPQHHDLIIELTH
jgi:predicted cupin superfamily sugar epimerase